MGAAIQAFVCTGRPFSFYDQLGRVVPDQLRAFCADRPHHVRWLFSHGLRMRLGLTPLTPQSLIGWFKFRRNTPPRLSARELEVHAQLCQVHTHNTHTHTTERDERERER
jgi:hypothetical protein